MRTLVTHKIRSPNDNPGATLNHIRWCRKELGERGVTWDFMGGHIAVTVMVYGAKEATLYLMKFPDARAE